jgi:hypothetical protein
MSQAVMNIKIGHTVAPLHTAPPVPVFYTRNEPAWWGLQHVPHVTGSVPETDPPDSRVFWPSGSTSQRYGSGSFYHHAKIIRKTLKPTIL